MSEDIAPTSSLTIYNIHAYSFPHHVAMSHILGSPIHDLVLNFLNSDRNLETHATLAYHIQHDFERYSWNSEFYDETEQLSEIDWERRYPLYLFFAAVIVAGASSNSGFHGSVVIRGIKMQITIFFTRMIMYRTAGVSKSVITPLFEQGMKWEPYLGFLMFSNEISNAIQVRGDTALDGFAVKRYKALVRACVTAGLRERHVECKDNHSRRNVEYFVDFEWLNASSYYERKRKRDAINNKIKRHVKHRPVRKLNEAEEKKERENVARSVFELVQGIGDWSRVTLTAACSGCTYRISHSAVGYEEGAYSFCIRCIVRAIIKTEISSLTASSSSLFDILFSYLSSDFK